MLFLAFDISKNKNMSTVDLSSQGLDGTTFKIKLQQAIQSATEPVVTLNLKQNKLDLDCIEFLLQQQSLIKSLKELNLSNNFTEKNSDAVFEKFLLHATFTQTSFEQLEKLDLGFNCISKVGASYLIQALSKLFPAIKELYLRYNTIGMEGAAGIAQLLVNSRFTVLDLTGNNITDVGCTYICQAAMVCPTLKVLGLWGPNGITDSSCDILCNLISINQTLEVLDISSNCLTQPSLEKLYNIMEKNNTGLIDLRVIGNHIKDRYIITKFNELNKKRAQAKEFLSMPSFTQQPQQAVKSHPFQFQQPSNVQPAVNLLSTDTSVNHTTKQNSPPSLLEQEWSKLNAAKLAFEQEKAQFQALAAQKEKEWADLQSKIEQQVHNIVQKLQAQGNLNKQVKINIVLKQ